MEWEAVYHRGADGLGGRGLRGADGLGGNFSSSTGESTGSAPTIVKTVVAKVTSSKPKEPTNARRTKKAVRRIEIFWSYILRTAFLVLLALVGSFGLEEVTFATTVFTIVGAEPVDSPVEEEKFPPNPSAPRSPRPPSPSAPRCKQLPTPWARHLQRDLKKTHKNPSFIYHQHIADTTFGKTAFELFHMMTNDMISYTETETNRNAAQKKGHSFEVNQSDIEKFLGNLFY
ncbi:hypothetical protein HNY73_004684 [Argiope bruennichi]|uniref:Uncharacterized protein n=1 Tax=Argiope bruennichi TaxID=94029 RepID=A0A8T0FPQ8_ARGBR|nr:hypothetical protein HNY73_004684 [Argiope bruennichi]